MNRLLRVGAATLALAACNSTEVQREIGYKGPARSDPWLAAERLVARMDLPVRPVIAWSAPSEQDAVWMLPAALLSHESTIRPMEAWVRAGGHLILLVEYADSATNDWIDSDPPPAVVPALLAMLARAGIVLNRPDSSASEMLASQVDFEGKTYRVAAQSHASVAVAAAAPGVLASAARGRGRLTVVTDGRLFRNRWLDQHEHAALLVALVDASRRRATVGFMRGAGVSLWGLVYLHLWPFACTLGGLLGLWLWKNLPRFGPIEVAVTPAMRSSHRHLQALGDFHWRLDHAASLVTRVRQQITEHGQRTSLRAAWSDHDFLLWLADRAGMTHARVSRAMATPPPTDPAALTLLAADLQQLLIALHSPSLK